MPQEAQGYCNLRSSPREHQNSEKHICTTLFSQDRPELYFHRKTADSKFDLVRENTYVQPLMQFFHSCIDFERRNEINKQELVLAEDFSIYNVFKALSGPGKKFLHLIDLHGILNRCFGIPYTFRDMKLALVR